MGFRKAMGLGFGVLAVASACGGTVSGKQSARDQLEASGGDRCEAACKALAECGTEPTCDCACDCPADVPDCCDVCTCEPPSPERCASDCRALVEEVLQSSAGCEDEMIAVLDCVEGPLACETEQRCRAESDVLEECMDVNDSPPIIGEPGSTGVPTTPVPACGGSFVGAAPLEPAVGDLACHHGWDGCGDGKSYEVQCFLRQDGAMDCQCLADGALSSTFVTEVCSDDPFDSAGPCGFPL